MMKFLAIAFLIGVACADPIPPSDDSYHATLPYHVSIRIGRSPFCSGSIISEDWILTSAQCGARHHRTFSIRAGSSYNDHGGSIHNVSRIIMHENYTLDSSLLTTNDIALIQVATPMTMDATRQPIELYKSGESRPVAVHVATSGFGHLRHHLSDTEFLIIHNLTTISNDECKNSYSYLAPEDPSQICANYDNNLELCYVDPGGPVTVAGRLAGIAVRGMGCPGNGRPFVYTDVGFFRNWIKEHSGV